MQIQAINSILALLYVPSAHLHCVLMQILMRSQFPVGNLAREQAQQALMRKAQALGPLQSRMEQRHAFPSALAILLALPP